MNRRNFLQATGAAFAALSASGCITRPPLLADAPYTRAVGYGALVPDVEGLLDLPECFSYRVLSSLGDAMSDGASVPDRIFLLLPLP